MKIEAKKLHKAFGGNVVLNGLDFHIQPGEIVGFLGPNGAGKTTTMRILTGFLAPTSGQVLYNDVDLIDQMLEVRRRIGYLPENNPLYPELRVFEYLRFVATVKQITTPDEEIRRVVSACGLADRIGQGIGTLSKGFRQRAGLAAALLGDPELLILDEPTSGLDPNQIQEIRHLIQAIGRTKTIILSTHILPEVQASCTRVLIISQGKIVGQGTTAELTSQAQGRRRFRIVIAGPREGVHAALQSLPGIVRLEADGSAAPDETAWVLEAGSDQDLRRTIFGLCRDRNWPLLEMQMAALSLEDVFRKLTTESRQPSVQEPRLP
ncbi:MAG: ATP-binding cassette domain-containing protein [Patescibacteria group bacterium]|nr:ATP-binding cassette domain-containing protein [Patescibacteria group bacterium]